MQIDPCVLYVFRCAVYYASHEVHDPDLLKWWNWKDGGRAQPFKESVVHQTRRAWAD
jgi:hypothetical protein